MSDQPPLILASGSPRRRDLLGLLDIPFLVDPSGADETPPAGAMPEAVAQSLALVKAREVAARHHGAYILGADTLVTVDDLILGKPSDVADAARMLRLLRGRSHQVPTGVALIAPDGRETALVETATVTMHPYTEVAISAYLATGEPFDKAGSYAVQGAGGALVVAVAGCYTTVVGLPLCRVAMLLRVAGFAVPMDPTLGCMPARFCALNPRGVM
jgi:septum formation protein